MHLTLEILAQPAPHSTPSPALRVRHRKRCTAEGLRGAAVSLLQERSLAHWGDKAWAGRGVGVRSAPG